MNNETLNQLNAFVADYKKEFEEKDAIIKKQNQILLHINAELAAFKQCNPFDLVLITGSIENISNVINGQTEPFIDEECVGCCRVQCDTELIERLSTEIHNRDKTIKDFKAIETKETDRLHEIILDMDVTISDLVDNDRKMNGFLDEYRVTVENRDKTIDDLESELSEKPDTIGMLNYTTNIEKVVLESQAGDNTINDLLLKLSITKEAVADRNRTIEELKDRNIEHLHELYDLYEEELRGIKADRTSIKSDRDIMFRNYHNTIAKLREDIRGLEAELSARKEDSEVLMKVVDAIRAMTEDARTCPQIDHLSLIVKDYLDAPEGPPETPIDDLYKVTVTYAFLEMP